MDYKKRLSALRSGLAEKEVDAVFISQPENRRYLSGFDGSYGYLLITPDAAILATDFRYTGQARLQAPDYEVFQVTRETADWFPKLVAGLGGKRLGFEAAAVTYAQYRELTRAIEKSGSGIRLIPVEGTVEPLRAIKDPEEIDLIKRAVALTDQAFEFAAQTIRAGITEKALAWEIEKFLRDKGSQTLHYDAIVASGANSALPHAKPSDRPMKPGEPVVIDVGARIEGYQSDMTRTFCIGEPDDTFARVYDIVLGAQLSVLALLKEGMTGSEADRLARVAIEEAGYGEAFGHGLGHGVGLATHESPRLSAGSDDRLVSGMVFTVEPGIYLPGWGGVRIEDDIIIEDGKPKVISRAKKARD